MKPEGLTSQLFEFQILTNRFTLLFTITAKNGVILKFEPLIFAKANTQEIFKMDINDKFFVNHSLSKAKYKEMVNFFEIPYNPNATKGFSPFDFLKDQIDAHLKPVSVKNYSRREISSAYHLENPNAIYYSGMKNWEVLNIGKSISEQDHVTSKNRTKVQYFLPDLYENIKNRDITTVFTETPKDEATEKSAIRNHLQGLL
ncbi:DUF6037 family protein [Lactococcus hircilactis]|uniref:DUF6037 family protein n=1 Tax=Lactococcus hircilactis TaxID=1494462 RepID=UPI003FA2DFAA